MVTALLSVTVMLRTSPAFNRLFCAPVADVMAMELTVGATSCLAENPLFLK
jgi:hypothetical protein